METYNGRYYIQQKGWFFWYNMCTELGRGVTYFDSITEAQARIDQQIKFERGIKNKDKVVSVVEEKI